MCVLLLATAATKQPPLVTKLSLTSNRHFNQSELLISSTHRIAGIMILVSLMQLSCDIYERAHACVRVRLESRPSANWLSLLHDPDSLVSEPDRPVPRLQTSARYIFAFQESLGTRLRNTKFITGSKVKDIHGMHLAVPTTLGISGALKTIIF